MNPIMQLEDWGDFLEVAEGCRDVYYQVQGPDLTAYAGRVSWSGQSDKPKLDRLKQLRARKVVRISDIERLFK